ncbi:thiamine biosynthesis protein ThiF [Flavobacterium akiainvivens]|uniref:Molybdopterin-synthase adenylyltransferase n=2 Tax=Flavobacterium akiainvivens TaxID=1202724 RepID=A0A0M9VHB6_9FLAO|nr:thiamine biosynthesis protein ThiF [Flavobacterium akiainvivens]
MESNERYARHYSLKGFGTTGQQKLAAARVLVIGAGGLGCPVLQYLASVGVGDIGIADHDTVSLSNLQRQVLFSAEDIGKPKAGIAAARLKALNPEISITTINGAITTANALEIITEYDVIVDCTDNFATRYLVNDACVLLDKPLVFGAISQYEGQVSVFNMPNQKGDTINYRHLFATPPNPLEVQDCNEAGVLGVLPGIIGTLQATEVIKIITGIGEVLAGKLLTFNLLNYQTYAFEITVHDLEAGVLPTNEAVFKATDYEWLCGTKAAGINELDAEAFLRTFNDADAIIIDVRENRELPKADFDCLQMPLSTLTDNLPEIIENNIILFCQSGKRSLIAGQLFLEHYKNQKNISHLTGGILALQEYGQKH